MMQIVLNLIKRHHHVFRFLIVGGISFIIDYGVLLLGFHVLRLPLAVATTIGFLAGLLFNFLLNKYWTFEASHNPRQTSRQVVLYTVLVGINLLLTNLIIFALSKLRVGPEISKPISTGFVMVINYAAYRQIIFKTASHQPIVQEDQLVV